MVSKRMKTEYMKKFKGPKWDTYSSCYTDLVQYRNTRRLLEQAHIPWVWTGWDSSSSSSSGSGASTPRVQERGEGCTPASQLAAPQEPRELPHRQIEPPPTERSRIEPPPTERSRIEPPPTERSRIEPPPTERSRIEPPPTERSTEKEIILEANQKDKNDERTKGELCVQPVLDYRRVKSASQEKSRRAPQSTIMPQAATKETKPPFAMYGWAKMEAKVGCKKTYNVGASALRGQIYESAVRAQDRRQVQRTMRVAQRRHRGTEPSSTRSADPQCKSSPGHRASEHSQGQVLKPAGPEDPWLSEYMRCYSTRSL
uniref:centriole, cilia and spindle-associated protein-like isoform X1 n=1 Tax=Pristiophorus japonicus TaxID=55135 RepID=UPI00398E509E